MDKVTVRTDSQIHQGRLERACAGTRASTRTEVRRRRCSTASSRSRSTTSSWARKLAARRAAAHRVRRGVLDVANDLEGRGAGGRPCTTTRSSRRRGAGSTLRVERCWCPTRRSLARRGVGRREGDARGATSTPQMERARGRGAGGAQPARGDGGARPDRGGAVGGKARATLRSGRRGRAAHACTPCARARHVEITVCATASRRSRGTMESWAEKQRVLGTSSRAPRACASSTTTSASAERSAPAPRRAGVRRAAPCLGRHRGRHRCEATVIVWFPRGCRAPRASRRARARGRRVAREAGADPRRGRSAARAGGVGGARRGVAARERRRASPGCSRGRGAWSWWLRARRPGVASPARARLGARASSRCTSRRRSRRQRGRVRPRRLPLVGGSRGSLRDPVVPRRDRARRSRRARDSVGCWPSSEMALPSSRPPQRAHRRADPALIAARRLTGRAAPPRPSTAERARDAQGGVAHRVATGLVTGALPWRSGHWPRPLAAPGHQP